MMIKSSLSSTLLTKGLITRTDADTILKNHSAHPAAFAKGVVALGLLDDETLADTVAAAARLPRVGPDLFSQIEVDALDAVDKPLMALLECVPIRKRLGKITFAVADPLDRSTQKKLEFFSGRKVKLVVASLGQIQHCLSRLIPGYVRPPTPFEEFIGQHTATQQKAPMVSKADGAQNFDFDAARSDEDQFVSMDNDDDEFATVAETKREPLESKIASLKKIDGDNPLPPEPTIVEQPEPETMYVNATPEIEDLPMLGVEDALVEALAIAPPAPPVSAPAAGPAEHSPMQAWLNFATMQLAGAPKSTRAAEAKRLLPSHFPDLMMVRGSTPADLTLVSGWLAGESFDDIDTSKDELTTAIATAPEGVVTPCNAISIIADPAYILKTQAWTAVFHCPEEWQGQWDKSLQRLLRNIV